MKYLTLFSPILLLLSSSFFPRQPVTREPRYVDLAVDIRAEMAEKLSQRYQMQLIGIEGQLANQVNLLGLSFQICGPLSQETLRDILVSCVEEFLIAVNSDEKIRRYLKNYPFLPDNIDITIFVIASDGSRLYDPNIAVASAFNNHVVYYTNDQTDRYKYKSIVEESYAEAKELATKTQ